MKKWICFFLMLSVILCACSKEPGSNNTTASGNVIGSVNGTPVDVDFSKTDTDMFTERDSRPGYTESGSVIITLNGDSVSCNSNTVKISGTTVTLTGDGTYILRGTLNNGMIIVDAQDTAKPQLVLDGVSITSVTSAPLYILEADKVFVTLAKDSQNTLANGGSFTAIDDSNIDAAVFSKQDLTFNGSGILTVSSPAGHGIVSKDDLVFTGGTYVINSASHGLDANDSIRITSANITVDAGKDGIHAENADDTALGFVYISSGTLHVEAEGDGISAGAYLQIEGGTFDILAGGGSENGANHNSSGWGDFMGGGGGRPGMITPPGGIPGGDTSGTVTDESSTSMKGLKAGSSILVSNGTFTIDSADDSVHANVSLIVNGGTFQIATGDDAFHAEDTLTFTAGTVQISESYEGLEALHVQVSGGDISLVASDDGINAAGGTDSSGTGGRDQMFGRPGGMGGMGGMGGSSNGSIVISGGKLYIQASGDGIDANGYLEITGGYTVVCGPNSGDTATLDYDSSGTITGGTFIGTGAMGMAQTFSKADQGVLTIRAQGQSAGVTITVKDAAGTVIMTHEPKLDFSLIIITSPQIVSGQTYHITVGSAEGDIQAS